MDENILTPSYNKEAVSGFPKALKSIAAGGLTVGVTDCLAATINAALHGVTFAQVWQYVASGLLGRESFGYGWLSVALGLLIHFLIAFSVTTIYYFASRFFTILTRRFILCGIFYGIAVYFVMAFVVVPLSVAAKLPFSVNGLLIGIFIHIVCVGLPITVITQHFIKTSAGDNI